MSSSKATQVSMAEEKRGRFEHLYAIVRVDEDAIPDSSPEDYVTVTSIVLDIESAEREVERLNKQAKESARYFWQTTRLKKPAEKRPSKWSPENRISGATGPRNASHPESNRQFLESVVVPEYIFNERDKGGFGFPGIRVYEVCDQAVERHYVKWHDLLATIAVARGDGFSDVVGLRTDEPKKIVMFAFRAFDDLCEGGVAGIPPLDLVMAFADRFGVEMSVGGNRGKFILEQQFDIPRIVLPNTPEGQVISVPSPTSSKFVLGSIIKLVPPKVDIALAFCIDTVKYDQWIASH